MESSFACAQKAASCANSALASYADPRLSYFTGFKKINLDCVIGRHSITIQLPPFNLARLIILKPMEQPISGRFQPASQRRLLNLLCHESDMLNTHTMEVL
jgi:hypothetical protein